jgi:hypothetical protein
MTREERLQFCQICTNRKMNLSQGLLCRLTNQKADFEGSCPSFNLDADEQRALEVRQAEIAAEEKADGMALERKAFSMGLLGGGIMMAVAVAWLFAGLMFDRLFYYPIILFVLGLVAAIKGLIDGNLAGKK